MRLSHAIVFVQEMERSVAFYRDVVGLPLRFQSPAWSEFAAGGATFALHLAENAGPGPAPEQAGACRPGFSVPDLEAFHQRALGMGVTCLQAPRSVFGDRVANYGDPDGLEFYVAEDRPEA